MPAVSSPEIPRPTASLGRSVRSTWTYTLGSIVFILVVLHFMLLSFAASDFTAEHDAVSELLLFVLLLTVALQVRYCWFLQAGLGGGLPPNCVDRGHAGQLRCCLGFGTAHL